MINTFINKTKFAQLRFAIIFVFLLIHSPFCQAEKITIFGGLGAIGSYFTMQLVDAGHEVTIIGREESEHLKYTENRGLTLFTSEGIKTIPANKFKYIGTFNATLSPQDLIIVSLKQPDLNLEAAQQIKHLTKQDTIVAIIANGLPFYFMQGLDIGPKKNLNSVDPNSKIINCLQNNNLIGIQPFIAAEIADLGAVKISRPLDKISVVIGSPIDPKSKHLVKVATIFQNAKINTTICKDKMHKNVLEKLQFALSVNVLSALMARPIDEIFIDPQAQPLIEYVIKLLETIAVGTKVGNLRDYQQFKKLPISKGHYSSLYKDIINHKSNESAAIIGATLELAEYIKTRNDVELPNLQALRYLQQLLERKSQGEKLSKADLDKLFALVAD